MGRGLLFIAARQPIPGMTKTRLGTAIGMARAAELYAAFLVDLAARFTPGPDDEWGFDAGWADTLEAIGYPRPSASVCFVPQQGEGWDVRQANVLRWGHDQGYGRTVLIGSDSPQLPLAVVQEAFAALDEADVAIGCTLDGGYYLIGMRGVHDVLTGALMSTVTVADVLATRSTERGLRLAELPETFDIDEEEDLEYLRPALAPDGAAAPMTWAALKELGLAAAPGA